MAIWSDPLRAMEHRRAEQVRHAENSTRYATAAAKFDSKGWGEFQFPDCFLFGLTFIEEPTVGYGYSIDGDLLIDTRYPRSFGFVVRYKIDTRGYYTGAWCAAAVDTRSVFIAASATDPQYDLNHSFVFTGLATKDIPEYLADD